MEKAPSAPAEREPGNVRHNANHPPVGCFASGRVSFGGSVRGYFSIQPGTCETVGLRAIFIAPTKLRMFIRSHSSGDTPSVSFADSSLREGAGNGCEGLYHSTGCSLMSGGTGDFHRPYENSAGITLYHGKSPGRRGSGDWGVSPGLGLRWTGPIPRGFWGRRR